MTSQHREPLMNLLPPAEPPKGLREAVLAHLGRMQVRTAWRRFAFDATLACVSAIVFVLSAKLFLTELASSGASQYLSVFFTAFWKESLLSFVEAFPMLIAAAPLAAVLVLLYSLQRAVIDGTSAFHHRKFV